MKKIILGLASLVLVFGLMGNVGAIGTTLYVNDDDATCGDNSPCYGTIQAAINDANDGDTIEVAAGTYEEQLTIDVSITLQGEDRETTIIEYPPVSVSDQYLVMVQANDVTIREFKLLGHFTTGNRAAYVVHSHSQGTGLIVEDNEIQGHIGVFGNLINAQIKNNIIGTNRKGVYIPGGSNVLNLLIEGNTIEPAEGASSYAYNCGAIYMDHAIDVTIQGNTMRNFSSSVDPGMTAGRGVEGSHNSYIIVLDNTFENILDAITMWIVTDIKIDGNTIANSDRYGINIKGQNINIINNEITGSGDSGVNIAEWVIPTQNVNVNFNNIVGNTNYGVKNTWVGEVNAENNWWGHASGPSGVEGRTNKISKVIGKGDAVSANVDWNPWLPQPVGHTPNHSVLPGLLKHNSLLENAEEVAPGVFYLGESINKGKVIEGYAFVHYAKDSAKSKPVWDDTVDMYKFMRGGLKWANAMQYKINPSYIGGLNQNAVETTLSASLEIWDSETSFELFDSIATTTETTSVGFDGTNMVLWGDLGGSGTIAQNTIWFYRGTKEIVESDVVFNTHYTWSVAETCPDNTMDMQNIATHEFGHNGLGDLYMPKSVELTMHGYSGYGETKKRSLGAGDKSGIQALYGN